MGPIWSLEEKHKVNLGNGYKNDKACAVLVEFIVQEPFGCCSKAKCFSIQADRSTNKET